jgi:hypothetical protein
MSKAINRKPVPLNDHAPKGSVCPICGKTTYSVGRIHPQCAMIQADAPRKQRLAEQRRADRTNAQADAERTELSGL